MLFILPASVSAQSVRPSALFDQSADIADLEGLLNLVAIVASSRPGRNWELRASAQRFFGKVSRQGFGQRQ